MSTSRRAGPSGWLGCRSGEYAFKAIASAAAARSGPLQEFYLGILERGMKEELARVTLARKLAALTLHIWKTGEHYGASKLSTQGA